MAVSKKEISPCPIDAMLSVIDGRWKGTILEAAGWADADERAAAEYSGDRGADVDPASPGDGEGRDH